MMSHDFKSNFSLYTQKPQLITRSPRTISSENFLRNLAKKFSAKTGVLSIKFSIQKNLIQSSGALTILACFV